MKVFISWSGKTSRGVAEALRNWLPDVLQAVDPFFSDFDISAGDRFPEVLQRKLGETHFGILCLTPTNHQAPWMLFEAGALAKKFEANDAGSPTKKFEEGRICPYLINLSPSELKQPLALYQAKTADRDGTLALLKSINRHLREGRMSETRLEKSFKLWWPNLESSLKALDVELAPPQTLQHFFLVQKSSGKCLQADGLPPTDEALIKLEAYNDIDRQKWSLHDLGSGLVAVISKFSKLCLDVKEWSDQSGARVHQYKFKHQDNQIWTIDKGTSGEVAVRLRVKHVKHSDFYLSAKESGAIQVQGVEGDDRLWYLQAAL
jgi:Ricin-type beta-trefoil lectin domain-like